jgi:hypothetical protein
MSVTTDPARGRWVRLEFNVGWVCNAIAWGILWLEHGGPSMCLVTLVSIIFSFASVPRFLKE